MIKQYRFVNDIDRFKALASIIDNYLWKVYPEIVNEQTSSMQKKFLTSSRSMNTPNATYTMGQKTNYDRLYLITAAQSLSVGAAVATGAPCLWQVVNVMRSTVSYFNGNWVFTTYVSIIEANRSADYTLSFRWMTTTQPTR